MIRSRALRSKGARLMDKMIIGGIEMPKTRQIEIGGEVVAKTATMASGKNVMDIVGFRRTISATWEYVPAETLQAIVSLARQGGYIEITYPDSTGGTATGNFEIEIGQQKIFKFVAGVPMWYNVELDATAQEVDFDAGA